MKKIQNVRPVVSNKKVCPRYRRLALDAPALARKIRPGQFLHIRVSDTLKPFFRRPFSVFRARKQIEILYEVVGPGTGLLAEKKSGDRLDVLGPLGKPFRMPGRNIKQDVMIAGGVGIAPFLILSDVLKERNVEMLLLYGARTGGHVFSLKEFRHI